MAHEVESMFSVREVPWHGLGNVLQDTPSIEEGIKKAGLDWNVTQRPLYLDNGALVQCAQANVRDSDERILGVVGNSYRVLQNHESFNWFQPFLDSNEATLESAGSLRNGARVWVLAKINRQNSEIVKGDEIAKFILLSNSHDGTQAVRVGFTPIRVVCANTMHMAHTNQQSKLVRVTHSGQMLLKVEQLREHMNLINQEFEGNAEAFRFLASKSINMADLVKYFKVVVGVKTPELSTRMKNIIEGLMQNFEFGLGNSGRTYWAAYNAVTEYLTYTKGRNLQTRFDSLWFGASAQQNKLAFNTAVAMAA